MLATGNRSSIRAKPAQRAARRRAAAVVVLLSLFGGGATGADRPDTDAAPVRMQLFIMSRCPFAAPAVLAAASWQETLGDRAVLEVRHIAREVGKPDASPWDGMTADGPSLPRDHAVCRDETGALPPPEASRFVSLHGPDEIEEDLRQFAIGTYFPDLYARYLRGYYEAFPESDWRLVCASLDLDPDAVEALRLDPGTADEFARNLEETHARGIRASPTLFVDGEFQPHPVNRWSLGRALCGRGIAAGKECAAVPVCGGDLDCAREGLIGECRYPDSASAECVFTRPVAITLTLLRPDDCPVCETEPVVAFLRGFLPLLDVRELSAASEEGRALAADLGVRYAPAYLLPRGIETFPRFDAYRAAFRPLEGYYAVDWEWLGAVALLDREPIPGRIDLIAGSLSPGAARVRRWLRGALPHPAVAERLYLPREEVLLLQPGDDNIWTLEPAALPAFQSPRGEREVEESFFQLALLRAAPASFPAYRACVDEHLVRGLDPASCRSAIPMATGELAFEAAETGRLQAAESDWVASLGLAVGPYALLVDNRILIRDFDEQVGAWLLERFRPPE